MVLAVVNRAYSSLGVIGAQTLAAEEKGNAWADDKGQAEELSEPTEGKGYSQSLLCRSSRDQTLLQDPGITSRS